MENLDLYNKVREVPDNAKKPITGGRLNGMTDINPMWRIKTLTEQFGVCGIGWKPKIVREWLDNGANGEIIANVEIELYVKVDGQWSDAIPGVGGSKFVAKESGGVYTDDECYKKAYTDALSVACKALGIGADVYFAKDSTKYDRSQEGATTPPNSNNKQQSARTQGAQRQQSASQPRTKSKWAQVNEAIKDTGITIDMLTDWIIEMYGKKLQINDLSDSQFDRLIVAIEQGEFDE